MKVVLSGGGTAGHINPSLALAEVLRAEGDEVLFAGTPQGIEERLVKQAGIPFMAFEAAGFNRQRPWTLVTSSWTIMRSARKARAWLSAEKPDAVVGFGGYVCIPVCMAAEKLGIPVVLHEQNSVMGMANKSLSKTAAAVALTYGEAAEAVADRSKVVVTGNPVRASVLSATREQGRRLLRIPEDAVVLLVFGGSLGARHINEAVASLKDRLLAVEGLHVVHITGPKEFEAACGALALSPEESLRWHVMAYQDRMAETLAAADCVLSRAGATSLAEIAALGIPALLVPFPYATGDHQTMNARSYVEAGAAFTVADDELSTPDFERKLFSLVEDAALRSRMHEAASKLPARDAAANLADVVRRCAKAAE